MKRSAAFLVRRHSWAFAIAVTASVTAVALAVGPPPWQGYDRSVAVLTATLVAVVWYTFFTYCAVHREERSTLTVQPQVASNKQLLLLRIENSTRERLIEFRVECEAWNDRVPCEITEKLRPGNDHWMSLRPGESIDRGAMEIPAMRGKLGSRVGPRVESIDQPQVALQFKVQWRDDLRDRGYCPPERWLLDRSQMKLARVKTEPERMKWQEVRAAAPPGRAPNGA